MFKERWLIGVALAGFLIVAGIIYSTSTPTADPTVAERVAHAIYGPLQRAVGSVSGAIGGTLRNWADLRDAQRENVHLKEEVERLQIQVAALEEAARENATLRSMVGLAETVSHEVVVGEVIAWSPNNWWGTIKINRGSRDGVEPGMAVVAPEGVVGRVRTVTTGTSEVLLITDDVSAFGGVVQATGERLLIEGTGRPFSQLLSARPLEGDGRLHEGDVIVTGASGIFPKGIPVGVIERVEQREERVATTGVVRPFVDFARLEWVAVILDSADDDTWPTSEEAIE